MKVVTVSFLVITMLVPVMLYGAGGKSSPAPNNPATAGKVSVIVIDPGHGGKDPGTLHGKTYEKDIVLNVAKELGEMITKNLPGVKVVYTRTTDVYIALDERSNIANREHADLFLSIHVNAVAGKSDANGTSTFVMGNDKSGKNLDVAMKENSVMQYEPNFEATYGGFVPDDPASYIMFNLQQFANQDQSMILAETIQRHYAKEMPLKDRGAYHGPFLVLWRTTMPSVLTEIGFITNKTDREYVSSAKGQKAAARALFNAFSEYKSRVEGRSTMVQLKSESPSGVSGSEQAAGGGQARQNVTAAPPQQQPPQQPQSKQQSQERPDTNPKARTTLPDISAHFPPEGEAKGAAAPGSDKPGANAAQTGKPAGTGQGANTAGAEQSASQPSGNPASSTAQTGVQRSNVLYYVQVAALDKPQNVNDSAFKSYRGKVAEKKAAGRYPYKYVVGGTASMEEIRRALAQVKKVFPDAFITAFDGDEQITPAEAQRRQNQLRITN